MPILKVVLPPLPNDKAEHEEADGGFILQPAQGIGRGDSDGLMPRRKMTQVQDPRLNPSTAPVNALDYALGLAGMIYLYSVSIKISLMIWLKIF